MPELVVPSVPTAPPPDGSLFLETYILDPPSEDPDGLPILLTGRDPGHSIYLGSIKFPEPDETNTRATGRDVEGDLPVGEPTHRNRSIPVEVLVNEAQGIGTVVNDLPTPTPAYASYWVAVAGGAVAASDVHHRASEESLRVTNAAAGDGARTPSFGTYNAELVYAVAWVWVANGSQVKLTLEEWDDIGGTGTFVGGTDSQTLEGTGGFLLFSVARMFGAPAGGHTRNARVKVLAADTTARPFYIDQVTVCKDDDPVFPFDGNTPGCTWGGTAYASASTRHGDGSDRVRFEKALYQLEEKLKKIDRYGGTLKRYLPDGTWEVFDLVGAKLTGDNWARNFNQGLSAVQFELEAFPYARLTPVTKTLHSASGSALTFTETIEGDVSALGRLHLVSITAFDLRLVVIGGRARTYDPATLLVYGVGDLIGASGAYADNTADGVNSVRLDTGSTFGAAVASVAGEEHVGTYRALVHAFMVHPGGVSLQWGQSEDNLEAAAPAGHLGGYRAWLDVGLIDFQAAKLGPNRWDGTLIFSTAVANSIWIDQLVLVPAEFGFARLSSAVGGPPIIHTGAAMEYRHDGIWRETTTPGTYYQLVKGFDGDLLRIPPSGKDGSPVQILTVAGTQGFGSGDALPANAYTAQLTITPRVIHVPDPA